MEGVLVKKSFQSENGDYIDQGEFWLEQVVKDRPGGELRVYTEAGYEREIKLTKQDLERDEVQKIDISMR